MMFCLMKKTDKSFSFVDRGFIVKPFWRPEMEILTHGLVASEVAEGYREQMTSNQVLMLKVAARALLFLESKLWTDCRGWLKVLEFSWQPCISKGSRGVVWACIWKKKEPCGRGMVSEVCLRSVWVAGNLEWSLQGASIALSCCIACRASLGS